MLKIKKDYFPNNKIQEAICQIAFKTSLELNKAEALAKSLIDTGHYFKTDVIPILNFTFSGQNITPQNLKGFKISNEKGDKIIQFFSDNISIHQIGNYEKWETFKEDILIVLNKFAEAYKIEIARIDLRMINNFDFIDNINKINQFMNIGFTIPSGNSFNTNSVNFSFEQIITPGTEFIAARSTYVQVQNRLLFDLSYVWFLNDVNLDNHQINKIFETLDKGNLSLYRVFESTISDTAKKLLK